ncbi:MAG: Holliday junction branch migration protein RuvA [Nitrospiraceae bacterium]|nr:Holliday junction branch migration protein RuvA [Nitrospiraceae bacterium]
MIGTLRGRLVHKRAAGVIVDVHGVGYEVMMPVSALSSLPEQGVEVFLHIHTHVREDGIKLFGFATEQEKQLFVTLLGVNGVGPKLALNILSGTPADMFSRAVAADDVAALSKIPGVGKKTAGRIILELKQKLPAIETPRDIIFEDALSALVNLGYRKTDALGALEKAAKKKTAAALEPLLKEALKELTERH